MLEGGRNTRYRECDGEKLKVIMQPPHLILSSVGGGQDYSLPLEKIMVCAGPPPHPDFNIFRFAVACKRNADPAWSRRTAYQSAVSVFVCFHSISFRVGKELSKSPLWRPADEAGTKEPSRWWRAPVYVPKRAFI